MENQQRIQIIILAATVLASFFAGLGAAPLFDKDEGAFCEATREMMASGNYLMPYLNGEPRYDKPILIYWLQAAGIGVFGLSEFGLRFPSAVAAAAWAWITFRFVRRVLGNDTAFLATFMLVTALQVTIIAKAAIADAVLNCFIAWAMFRFYLFYSSGEKKHLYWGSVATALGVLTKGPVAILVPLGTTFIFCLVQRDLKRWVKSVFNPVGILLFAAITAPWYIAAVADQGRPILVAWILKQNIGRFQRPLEGHGGSLFYYIPVVLAGVMPFTALLFKAGRAVREDLKEPLRRYLIIWFVFVFVFFSFSGTKLPHYVIYGYTPLFILFALHLDRVRSNFLLVLPSMILLVLLLALPFLIPVIASHTKDEFARIVMQDAGHELGLAYHITISAALLITLALALIPAISRTSKIVVLGWMTVIVVNFAVMPAVGRITQAPIKEAARIAKELDADVILWKLNMPSFIFYRQKIVPERLPVDGDLVLAKVNIMRALAEYDPLYENHGIVLGRVTRILSYERPDRSGKS